MMKQVLFILLFSVIYVSCQNCSVSQMPLAQNKAGYCSSIWYSGLSNPRGLVVLSNDDVLVVEAGAGRVSVLWEGLTGNVQKATLVTQSGLNHGLAVSNGYLYASTGSTVYRWAFSVGTRSALGASQVVVSGMPSGGHSSRTLLFGSNPNVIYVSVGSGPNVDTATDRSAVYSFDISGSLPKAYSTRVAVARGVRNECGIRFDSEGQLWGVENGPDNLNRADLGGDIHNDNPGEEINALGGGAFYGYPYCWSQYNLPSSGLPRKTQWAWPDFMNTYSDGWCRNVNNNKPPSYLLPAHTAPLDIIFKGSQDFPGISAGDALVSEHGSWNRNPAVGYLVAHVKYENGVPVSDDYLMRYQGPGATGSGWHRPVGLGFGKVQGADSLFVTSDATGVIIAITSYSSCQCRGGAALPPTPSPTPTATPAPTPTATPSPTPAATPAPTPKATPSPTPQATPAPTPKATPSPTPQATPAPTPKATPSPTTTPCSISPVGTGSGLTGDYHTGNDAFPLNYVFSRVDSSINFNWGSGSPSSSIPSDNFAVRWTGQVQPRYSGVYTFYTSTDDGARLYVNNALLVDSWVPQSQTEKNGKITLSAGVKYNIVFEYKEIGGQAAAVLSWSSPCQTKQVIPTSQLYPCIAPRNAAGNGLTGRYYSDDSLNTLIATQIDSTVDFNWGTSGPAVLAGRVDDFSVSWTGLIQPRFSGSYTFYGASDDGVRVYVDNKLVVDAWVDRSISESSGSISLVQGRNYTVRLDYYENGGDAEVELKWSNACEAKSVVPQSQLFSS